MRAKTNYGQSLRIWRSHFGREAGWLVELRGAVVATLTEPRPVDMFWDEYLLTSVTSDVTLRDAVASRAFWGDAEQVGLRYRSVSVGQYAEGAFPGLEGPTLVGGTLRIRMRALYIPHREPNVIDHLVLRLASIFWHGRTDAA